MILGIGTDIVNCERFDRPLNQYSERFLKKILTSYEINYIEEKVAPFKVFLDEKGIQKHICLSIGKIFAAKEAFVKALGTGFRDGVRLQDVEVRRTRQGKPYFHITGHTRHVLDNLSPIGMHSEVHLTLSDEAPYATAYVIISAT